MTDSQSLMIMINYTYHFSFKLPVSFFYIKPWNHDYFRPLGYW